MRAQLHGLANHKPEFLFLFEEMVIFSKFERLILLESSDYIRITEFTEAFSV